MTKTINFSGTWKADLSRSRLLGPPAKAISATIVHSEPALEAEIVVCRSDENEQQVVFKSRTSGEEGKSFLNGTAICGTSRWEGQELVIESWVQAGGRKMHFCDYWSLSPDGQTLVMEHRNDDLAGQRTVLDRVR